MKETGKRIRQKRIEKHLTQFELGKLVNVSAQVVSNWERGYTPTIDLEDINNLADALGVTADWLLGRSSIIDKPTYQTEVQFPLLLKEDNPNLELYISEIQDVVAQAVGAGDIPAEDAEELIKANIRYLKFQIEEKRKK